MPSLLDGLHRCNFFSNGCIYVGVNPMSRDNQHLSIKLQPFSDPYQKEFKVYELEAQLKQSAGRLRLFLMFLDCTTQHIYSLFYSIERNHDGSQQKNLQIEKLEIGHNQSRKVVKNL